MPTAFDPSQLHEQDATEPHIRLNVYHADALPREPIRIVRGQPEQTVAWPKHGSGIFTQSAQQFALTGEDTGVQFSSKVRSDPHLQERKQGSSFHSKCAAIRTYRRSDAS